MLELEDYDGAITCAEAAVRHHPRWGVAWVTLGRAHLNLGSDLDAALYALREGLRRAPEMEAEVAPQMATVERLCLERDEVTFEFHHIAGKRLRLQPWAAILDRHPDAIAAAAAAEEEAEPEGEPEGPVPASPDAVAPLHHHPHHDGALAPPSASSAAAFGTGFAIWDCSIALGWYLEHLERMRHTQRVTGHVAPASALPVLEALTLPGAPFHTPSDAPVTRGERDRDAAAADRPLLPGSPRRIETAERAARRLLVPLRDVRVFELGSGNGVAGLAAAALGADVTLSDELAVLPQLRRNVSLNAPLIAASGGKADVTACRWEEVDAMPYELLHCDLVLGADLLYRNRDDAQIEALCRLLRRAMAPTASRPTGARLLLAHKCRHDALDARLVRIFREVGRIDLAEASQEGFRPTERFHLGRVDMIRFYVGAPIVRARRGF